MIMKNNSYKNKNKSGQAMIVVLMICLFLGILSCTIFNLQSSQINLLSKSAKDYIALSVAETGLHCVLAEMKADYQFVTHGNPYIPAEKDKWPSPVARKYNYIGKSKLLHPKGNNTGVYEGTVEFPETKLKGEFKVRIKLIKSQNSTASQSVDEAHRYFLLESYGKVGDSYRKISTVIEKFVPGNFILYDGQVLDVGGYGPYRLTKGLMNNGRFYGHEMIIFSKRGSNDSSADLSKTEKISTPGYIRAETSIDVEFFGGKNGGKKGVISPKNDSTNPDKFETFPIKIGGKMDRFVLDGNHGGKPQLLPPLNPSYYREAKKPHPEILRAGSSFDGFSESKWRNPEKPGEKVYDLFFGWKYKKTDDNFLIYSEVPLRVWGCPKWKALTIFCEKDVYIAGDLNANPDSPQRYKQGYREYSKELKNGTDKNGLQIMSMGRIWFDYSNPMNFLRNEMETVIDYDIACCLTSKEPSEAILLSHVWPPRNNTGSLKLRLPFTYVNFTNINILYNIPKDDPRLAAALNIGVRVLPPMYKLNAYFKKPGEKDDHGSTPVDSSTGSNNNGGSDSDSAQAPDISQSVDEKLIFKDTSNAAASIGGATGSIGQAPTDDSSEDSLVGMFEKPKFYFPIKNMLVRGLAINSIGMAALDAGIVPPLIRDKSIKLVLDEAEKELNEDDPDEELGPWNIADRIFELQVHHKESGLRFPEMTVNALLIDSAELNAKWNFGNDGNKVNNELGNIQNDAMRSFQWMKNKNSRFILRHNGSMIHLRNRPVKEYIKGNFKNDEPVIRQITYDRTYALGGGDYYPPYQMAGFTIINWNDEYCSEETYNKVN